MFSLLRPKAIHNMNIGYVGESCGQSPFDRSPIVGDEQGGVQMAERFVSGDDIPRRSRTRKTEMATIYVSIRSEAIEAVISTVNRKYQLAKVLPR